MFLVDTNVWLERLLDQDRATEVSDFLDRFPSECLFMTDFALHPIGVVLTRLNQPGTLFRFVQDTFVDGAVVLIHQNNRQRTIMESACKGGRQWQDFAAK
jgi:hypothetical protein